MPIEAPAGVELFPPAAGTPAEAERVLTPDALAFVRRTAFDPPTASFDAAFSSS